MRLIGSAHSHRCDLLKRARLCAENVDATLVDWSRRALEQHRRGALSGVAVRGIGESATRKSVVATLYGDQSEAEEMRKAIEACVIYCEQRRPPLFTTPLREGVDYIVEREDE